MTCRFAAVQSRCRFGLWHACFPNDKQGSALFPSPVLTLLWESSFQMYVYVQPGCLSMAITVLEVIHSSFSNSCFPHVAATSHAIDNHTRAVFWQCIAVIANSESLGLPGFVTKYNGKPVLINRSGNCESIVFFVLPSNCHSFYFLSLVLIVLTQIRGDIAGSSPPSPLRFVPCIFIARRLQPLLPSSTHVGLRLPYPRYALSEVMPFLFQRVCNFSSRWGLNSRNQVY